MCFCGSSAKGLLRTSAALACAWPWPGLGPCRCDEPWVEALFVGSGGSKVQLWVVELFRLVSKANATLADTGTPQQTIDKVGEAAAPACLHFCYESDVAVRPMCPPAHPTLVGQAGWLHCPLAIPLFQSKAMPCSWAAGSRLGPISPASTWRKRMS